LLTIIDKIGLVINKAWRISIKDRNYYIYKLRKLKHLGYKLLPDNISHNYILIDIMQINYFVV